MNVFCEIVHAIPRLVLAKRANELRQSRLSYSAVTFCKAPVQVQHDSQDNTQPPTDRPLYAIFVKGRASLQSLEKDRCNMARETSAARRKRLSWTRPASARRSWSHAQSGGATWPQPHLSRVKAFDVEPEAHLKPNANHDRKFQFSRNRATCRALFVSEKPLQLNFYSCFSRLVHVKK